MMQTLSLRQQKAHRWLMSQNKAVHWVRLDAFNNVLFGFGIIHHGSRYYRLGERGIVAFEKWFPSGKFHRRRFYLDREEMAVWENGLRKMRTFYLSYGNRGR